MERILKCINIIKTIVIWLLIILMTIMFVVHVIDFYIKTSYIVLVVLALISLIILGFFKFESYVKKRIVRQLIKDNLDKQKE